MAENSGIAWTNHTLNPWIGCTKVGKGCDHCYAEAMDGRFGGGHWGPRAPRLRTSAKNWGNLRRWNAAAARTGIRPWVFIASLADVLDKEVDPAWRADLWAEVRAAPNLNFQFVTKRIGNAADMLAKDWRENFSHCGIISTVVTQKGCDRELPKLLALKKERGVAWVGLSMEPQLELVIPKLDGLDWVITGGESDQGGPNARLYSTRWTEALLGWGVLNDVPIFVKQMGSILARELAYRDRAGADPSEWPEALRVRLMPKGVPTMLEAV